jgi:hypothetical protein
MTSIVKGALIVSDKTFDLIVGKKTKVKPVGYVTMGVALAYFLLLVAVDTFLWAYGDFEVFWCIAPFTVMLFLALLYSTYNINRMKKISEKRKMGIYEERENKFRQLPPEQQEEIIQITECFQRVKHTGCNEHYVWGSFEKVRKSNSIWGSERKFEYIPYTDIMWVHMYNSFIPIIYASEADIYGLELSLKSICIYTYNGECYRCPSDLDFYRLLRLYIPKINPMCNFGYTKELKNEYEHLKKIRKEFK